MGKRINGAAAFLRGFNDSYNLVNGFSRDRELEDIASAKPVTTDGYSAADGQQLEAIANAKDENGAPYYSVGTDALGKYTVTPNQGGAGGEAGQAVQMPTRPRMQFLDMSFEHPLDSAGVNSARNMAMAGVLKKYGDVRGGVALEQQVQQGQREDQRYQLEKSRGEREERAGAQREADDKILRDVDQRVAEWTNQRLAQPDGTTRDMTPDDHLASGQFRVAQLVGAGKMAEANALAKDNMQLASSKIQLQTAERQEAIGQTAAAVSAGDLNALVPFYEKFVPDGAHIKAVTKDPRTGQITIERETLDGKRLSPKVAKSADELLAGLKAFSDPMAVYNFSQSEFARNLHERQEARADKSLGIQGAQANASIEHSKAQTAQIAQQTALSKATGSKGEAPAGYRWKQDGSNTMEAIPGGPGDKNAAGVKTPAEVQRMNVAMRSLKEGLGEYETLLKDFNPRNPGDQMSPEKRARADSLMADLQLQFKEAQALGALTGPDIELVNKALASPTSLKGGMLGVDGLRVQVSETRKGIARREAAIAAEFGSPKGAAKPGEPAKPGETVADYSHLWR